MNPETGAWPRAGKASLVIDVVRSFFEIWRGCAGIFPSGIDKADFVWDSHPWPGHTMEPIFHFKHSQVPRIPGSNEARRTLTERGQSVQVCQFSTAATESVAASLSSLPRVADHVEVALLQNPPRHLHARSLTSNSDH